MDSQASKTCYGGRILERGASLPMGQRQLIALARAMAFDPSILVLDEATSSINPKTEYLFQQAIAELDYTLIAIAHRLSTVQHVDRILVLHKGELREEGTYKELLKKGGIYARLSQLQFDGHRSQARIDSGKIL